MDELILHIDGYRFTGWETVAITRSMEQGPHEFELTLTNRWRASGHRPIRYGQSGELLLDNDLLVTGSIDGVMPDYDATRQTLAIRGRSKIADLVDCSTIGKTFQGQTLDAIARQVCQPFGVDVLVNTDVGKPFNFIRQDDGQSPWEFLDFVARLRGVRLLGNEKGQLVLTRTGTRLAKEPLILGGNVQSARGNSDFISRFSEYLVVSKNGDFGLKDPQNIAHVQAVARDKGVQRYRPVVIVSENDGTVSQCQTQADWQRNTHYGRSQQVTYTIKHWRENGDGEIWTPNTRVYVEDGYMDFKEERLITGVRLIEDEQGKRTELTVMPKEAMDLVPLPEPKYDQWGALP